MESKPQTLRDIWDSVKIGQCIKDCTGIGAGGVYRKISDKEMICVNTPKFIKSFLSEKEGIKGLIATPVLWSNVAEVVEETYTLSVKHICKWIGKS